jgi:5-methylcytosine-specific restriction protein A
MDFKPFHKYFFGAKTGAFSKVTDREDYDSQITLTDIEAEIVISHFGHANINIGGVKSDQRKSAKKFLLYPDFIPIELNLIFPKPHKTELRLYIAKSRGFRPLAGQVWFIYVNEFDHIVIGALPENLWGNIGQEDADDDFYQTEIEKVEIIEPVIKVSPLGKIIKGTLREREVFIRDPRLAILRFRESGYKCEIDSSHDTFIAEATQKQYVEAHHFIPIKFQTLFKKPLDNLENIVSLCPNCHRGIHHGIIDYKRELIAHLYEKRPQMHEYEFEYIAQFYNSLKIA